MVAVLKDSPKSRGDRPMQGVVIGVSIGALLWIALAVIVVAL